MFKVNHFPLRNYIFLKSILSCILAIILLSSETGLKFEGSELSPFFGIGITFANFQIFIPSSFRVTEENLYSKLYSLAHFFL